MLGAKKTRFLSDSIIFRELEILSGLDILTDFRTQRLDLSHFWKMHYMLTNGKKSGSSHIEKGDKRFSCFFKYHKHTKGLQ